MVAIRVYPSSSRPHYLRKRGPEEGVLIRVGSTNRRADQEIIEELRRIVRNESFDEQAMPEMRSEAIDFRAASELFSPIRKLRRPDLHTLRITTTHQGREVPTVGGLLLFGREAERERYFPDARVQAGRFLGKDRRRIIDNAELRGHLPEIVEGAQAFVTRNIAREAVIKGVRRIDRWTFPLGAVREALINAVVHADYAQRGAPIRVSIFDDRIELENPGLLPFGLTVEDIRHGISKLRNRVIGRTFHALGLIEQWGSGIQRMTAACLEAGLDAPRLEELGTHFRVTILAARRQSVTVDEVDSRILEALGEGKGLSTQQISDRIERSARATRTRLRSLIERGHVVEVGSGPNDPKRRYFLASS